MWNFNWWKKNYLHWFVFWSHYHQEKCAILFFRVWRVTSRNGVQETIYEPRDKLYEWEWWKEIMHCIYLHKIFLSIIEIENKKSPIWFRWKTQIELVSYKLIISLDGLHISNSTGKIDHQKCKILAKDTIVLDDTFQNYFKGSFLKILYAKMFPQVVLNQ